MDPSSIASAAARLLGLTIQVSGSLYGDWDYPSRMLAGRLVYELSQLRNALQSLEVTALSVTKAVIIPKDLLICLEDIRRHLVRLVSKFLKHEPPAFSDHEDALPWHSINCAGSPQACKLPIAPTEALDEVQYLQHCLTRLMNSIENSPFSSSKELLLKHTTDLTGALWRDCAEYRKIHESVRSSRIAGTGLWFVNNPDFKRWLAGKVSSKTVFCSGLPGSGKTVLTSLAIDEVKKRQQHNKNSNAGLAYFYFSHKRLTPLRNVALALLEQLYLQSSSPIDEVTDLESHAAESKHIPFPRIVSALQAVSRRFWKTYIILDALNECLPDHQHDLLYLLAAIRDSPMLLFTSSSARQAFGVYDTYSHIEVSPSNEDIKLYAHAKLHKESLLLGNQDLLDKIVSVLTETAEQHRLFLSIVFRVEAISCAKTRKEIMQQLNKVPKSLNAVFKDILDQILDQETHMAGLAKRTLTWLLCSHRPLQTEELLEIHRSFSPEAPETDASMLVKACMGLVQAGKTITFVHFSAKEYLKGTLVDDEEMVSLHCMKYLLNSSIDQPTTPESLHNLLKHNPILHYAASFWGCHLCKAIQKQGPEQDNLKHLCSALLKDKPRVTNLCHIAFVSQPVVGNGALGQTLMKSSWLHLVSHFGLDWAISPPITEIQLAEERDGRGRTPLHVAAEKGFTDCVKALLTQTSWIQEDLDGRTVWHYVAMSGNSEAMQWLVMTASDTLEPGGTQLSARLAADKLGRTPLEYAADNGDLNTFRWLLSLYGPESTISHRGKAFSAAVAGLKMDIVKHLSYHGFPPSYEHLLLATGTGSLEAVRHLLLSGTQVENPDPGGESALLMAAREGQNDILRYLAWSKRDPDWIRREGQAALDCVVKMGNVEGLRNLLCTGARPRGYLCIDEEDQLLVYAARKGMVDIVDELLKVEQKASQAAFAAAEEGQVEVLQMLLESEEYRPPLEARSDAGQSLLEVAREGGHSAVVDILHAHKADGSPRVIYSILPEDVLDPNNSDAIKPATPSPEVAPPDEDAVLSGGTSLISRVFSVEHSPEQSTTKSGEEETDQLTQNTRKPRGEGTTLLGEFQASELEVRPTSAQTNLLGASGVGLSTSPKNCSPFFLLSESIGIGNLVLGSIVVNPKNPLGAFAPHETSSLSKLVEDLSSSSGPYRYNTVNQSRSTTSIALEALRPILNPEGAHDSSFVVESQQVVRERLHNHELALSRILHNPSARNEILDVAKTTGKKELLFVVGLLIARDAHSGLKQGTATGGTSTATKSSEPTDYGSKILAISYRVVKIQPRGALSDLTSNNLDLGSSDVFLDNYFTPEAHDRLL